MKSKQINEEYFNQEFFDSDLEYGFQKKDNEHEEFLLEGLVVDEHHKTVSLTEETEDGVDFSNKRYLHYTYHLDGKPVDVISIFKRTPLELDYKEVDGNPFIYALKNKDGWKFDISNEEIVHYVRRFLEVCDTIDKKYDTIVVVPSSHDINVRFMTVIAKRVEAENLIPDMFIKCTKAQARQSIDNDEIWDYCDEKWPRNSDYMQRTIKREIDEAFRSMEGNEFEAKKFPKQYIRFVKKIVTYRNGYSVDDAYQKLHGKSVLVLDDTISTGASLSACVRCISTYGPSRLDVITLLSKKFKNRK